MKALVMVAAVCLSACSASSSYTRTAAGPGELVWAFDGRLKVMRNGRMVADSSWAGLAEAIGCVPRAGELATSARTRKVTGKTLVVLGGVVGIGAIAGGTALALSDEDRLGSGLAVLSIGTVAFAASAITGALLLAHSDPNALDAVNIYNDSYQSTPGCSSVHRSASLGRAEAASSE